MDVYRHAYYQLTNVPTTFVQFPKCTKLLKRMYRVMIFVSMPVKNRPTAATHYTRVAATGQYTQ